MAAGRGRPQLHRMTMTRRMVLRGAGGLVAGAAASRMRAAPRPGTIRAVAVDAFVLFDPRPFTQALEAAFPGRGPTLAAGFRTRLFEYGWLRALGRRYLDFWQLSEDALDDVAVAEGVALAAARRAALLDAWGRLPPWPDAIEGMERLARQGLELAVLSNWSPRMIEDGLARAGLQRMVRPLSTDAVRSYKPDPRAYRLGCDALGLPASDILFVAFAGWDAAGGSWFGFPTVWMNRAGAPRDRLGGQEIPVARAFTDLVLPG